jgi:hypothetical protein
MMGYYVSQEDAEFFISKDNFDRCLAAIKGLMGQEDKMTGESWSGGVQTGRWFYWVDTEKVLAAQTLIEALGAWQWEAVTSDGDIVDILFQGEKLGADDNLFETIAPFVKCGSYIEMRGEEGELWRYFFKGGKMFHKEPIVSWD